MEPSAIAAPVPVEPVKLPPVIFIPSKRTVAVVPPLPMGLNTFSTLVLPLTVHLVVGSNAVWLGSDARVSGANVGAAAHTTSSPLLGTIVAEAVYGEGQFAVSTKRVAMPRSSQLITLSMSSPHPMETTRGRASACE